MMAQQNEAGESHSLKVLGVSEAEERVYRWLIGHSGSTIAEIAHAIKLSPGKIQRLIEAIETKGLVTRSPERPRRYLPAAPDIALKALSLKRQEELQNADFVIQELQEQLANQREDKREQIVELLTSREAVELALRQMMQSARREVVAFSRPPMLVSLHDEPFDREKNAQREAQARGVHFRTIADSDFLTLPNAIRSVQADIKAGEEVRLVSNLPIKLVLVDRNIALVPLNLEKSDSASLLIRSSALLNLFYELFEDLWSRAAPISFPHLDKMEVSSLDDDEHEKFDDLLKLMAAGVNDKTIISELDISESTLTRSVTRLKQTFGARTRFQLGWLVNQHMNQR